MRSHPYRLHAAFFHRGTQGSGHYWVYIYDFKQEIWRKYNDGYVTTVQNRNEIFAQPTEAEMHTWSGPANPYFLVYVKDEQIDRLVQSVHRNIVYPSTDYAPPQGRPPRSQMTELPPERMDYKMAGVQSEQASRQHEMYTPDPNQPIVHKEGDWDNTEHLRAANTKW